MLFRSHASLPWPCVAVPVRIAASRARSAGERVSRAAASSASPAPGEAAAEAVPSPSVPWWASVVPAFAFSAWLVQTLVQTAGGVDASSLPASLASLVPLLDKLGVGGSSPLAPTRKGSLTAMLSGPFVFTGVDLTANRLPKKVSAVWLALLPEAAGKSRDSPRRVPIAADNLPSAHSSLDDTPFRLSSR